MPQATPTLPHPDRNHNGQFLRISEASALLGVSQSTVRTLCESGDIQTYRTVGGHRRVCYSSAYAHAYGVQPDDKQNGEKGGIAIYCRTSSESQRESLNRQTERLLSEVAQREGISEQEIKVYREVASSYGNRKALNSLIDGMCEGKVSRVYVEFEDRLSRIESTTSIIFHIANRFGVEIVCLDTENTDPDDMAVAMGELLKHSQVLCARMAARKSALICRKVLPPECVQRIVKLRQSGMEIKTVWKMVQKEGYRTEKNQEISYYLVLECLRNGTGSTLGKIATGEEKTPLQQWLTDGIEKTDDLTLKVRPATIYDEYARWCAKHHYKTESRARFGRIFSKGIERDRIRKRDGRNIYLGFRLT